MARTKRAAQPPVGKAEQHVLWWAAGAVLAPHVAHVPVWVTASTVVILVWRYHTMTGRAPSPPRLIRLIVAGALIGAVIFVVGLTSWRQTGVAILVPLMALRLFEIERYVHAATYLQACAALALSQFLYAQSLVMLPMLVASVFVIVNALAYLHAARGTGRNCGAAREALLLMALAAPVAAAAFVLVPRLPGPLWGNGPDPPERARTGLSDHMRPGAISRLAKSSAVALRVDFDQRPPAPEQRYWRGPVLWDFVNGTWRTLGGPRGLSPADIEAEPVTVRSLSITLEPTHTRWLIALDVPLSVSHAYTRTPGATLRLDHPLERRLHYTQSAALGAVLDRDLPPAARAPALALPQSGNPRARALAQRWAARSKNARAIADAALARFHQQAYVYTLSPARVSRHNGVDDFLFRTREGFCEHYAGAFTYLMRAAGVPARVVTGYQGAERGVSEWIVRQSDAHAWSEVWFESAGWVRIDPTAAVAPERIRQGIAAALPDSQSLFAELTGSRLWFRAQLAWDAIGARVNAGFLGYDAQAQQSLLDRLPHWPGCGTAALLAALAALLLTGLASRIARAHGRRPPATQRAWHSLCGRLARAGMPRRTGETAIDYAERVAAADPDRGAALRALAEAYTWLRYDPHAPQDHYRVFVRSARRMR